MHRYFLPLIIGGVAYISFLGSLANSSQPTETTHPLEFADPYTCCLSTVAQVISPDNTMNPNPSVTLVPNTNTYTIVANWTVVWSCPANTNNCCNICVYGSIFPENADGTYNGDAGIVSSLSLNGSCGSNTKSGLQTTITGWPPNTGFELTFGAAYGVSANACDVATAITEEGNTIYGQTGPGNP